MKTQHQVLFALILIMAVSVWAIAGSSQAAPYLDVHHVTRDPAAYAERTVSVKGDVIANTTETSDGHVRFLLGDASGDAARAHHSVSIFYSGVLPDAFGPNKMVVVTGTLVETPNGLTLQATDIQVGCSSKY